MRFSIGALSLMIILSSQAGFGQSAFEFALVGDNPYSSATYDKYLRLIENVNAEADIQWVLHLGDVKGGGQSCSDEELQSRFELNQRFDAAYVITPGDNDWLDCKRIGAGGFNEYERLDKFREIFFSTPGFSTGSEPMAITQQSATNDFPEFVENSMWEKNSIVFAAVHVLALTEPATDPRQFQRRNMAATAWIESTFQRAKQIDAKGVFLAMQADPWIVFGLPNLARRVCETCLDPRPTLEWLYPVLREQS